MKYVQQLLIKKKTVKNNRYILKYFGPDMRMEVEHFFSLDDDIQIEIEP